MLYYPHMRKLAKKEINRWLAFALVLVSAVAGGQAIVTEAASREATFAFEGTVLDYQQYCQFDPVTESCDNCILCTGELGPACGGFQQVVFIGHQGPNFICPFQGFPYQGDRTKVPVVNGYVLGQGVDRVGLEFVGVGTSGL